MNISRYFDLAVLAPELTEKEVRDAIQMGIDYEAYSVCVRPCDINLAKSMCKGTNTLVSCVLDFPHGDSTPEGKGTLAQAYASLGVDEIDMVMNYGAAKSGDWQEVEKGIEAVSTVCKKHNIVLKVIFETCQLNIEEIKKATKVSISAGADFVKTSTGFSTAGASREAVAAMLEAGEGKIKVKASGGIRNYKSALEYVEMGAERLGVGFSSVPAICAEEIEKNS